MQIFDDLEVSTEVDQGEITDEDWADFWQYEQDKLNERSQEIKKEVEKNLNSGKIKLSFDQIKKLIDKLKLPEEVVFVTKLITNLVRIIEYALPLLAKFFPVTRLGYAVISGLSLLKLFLNTRLERRLKMELKNLDKDTAEVVIFGCELLNGIGKSLEDSTFSMSDALNFKDALMTLPAAISGAANVKLPEGEALDELVALVKARFDIPQDKAESLAEKGLEIGLSLYKSWLAYSD